MKEEGIYKILLEMKEDIGEMKSDVKSNLAQSTRTNGRVDKLEEEMRVRKEFEDTWKGKIAIIGVFLGFIGTIAAGLIKKILGI